MNMDERQTEAPAQHIAREAPVGSDFRNTQTEEVNRAAIVQSYRY